MGRPARYDRASIVEAALSLVAEGGPSAATIAAIAERLGAPTGSIYHRFRSRRLLLAELWLTVVEGYQEGLLAELEAEEPREAAVAAAIFMPRWVRDHLPEARLLLLHHRDDFVGDAWPEELARRAAALAPALNGAVRRLAGRLFEPAGKDELRRVRFALVDVSWGAVRRYVEEDRRPPPELDALIEVACRAVLADPPDARPRTVRTPAR